MNDSRHFDPFSRPMGRPDCRLVPKRRRWPLRVLLALAAVLAVAAVSAASVYGMLWLSQRQVDLTGRKIVFHPVEKDSADALSLPELYEKCRPVVVNVMVQGAGGAASSSGTGFVLTEDGYIATCAHVVTLPDTAIFIGTCDGQTFPAALAAYDSQTDIAVLKAEVRGFAAAELGISSEVVVGETAATIGNPLGRNLGHTLTAGWVSARERTVTIGGRIMELVQFDAAVNSGNSGGPLLNSRGQVIGMVNAKIERDGEEPVEGLGFAIPVDRVAQVAQDLIQYGFVQDRPWLGIVVQNPPEGSSQTGLLVLEVTPGSAAEQAGLRAGDWLTAFNGVPARNSAVLNHLKDQCAVGETVALTVRRGDAVLSLTCLLGAMPADGGK